MNRPEILAPREADIMSRWDAGRSIEQIAAELGTTRKYTSTVVNRYAETNADRIWRTNAAKGSAELLKALTGKRAVA